MVEKKVHVKPHQRQTGSGETHVRAHTRNQEVKNKQLPNQEIPEENEGGD